MKRKVLLSVATLLTTLPLLAQDNEAQRVEQLRQAISQADQQAAQTIVDHSTYIFMHGLLNEVGMTLGRMSAETLNSPAGRQAVELYNSIHLVDVGSLAPDFRLPDPEGREVHFQEFLKGKRCVIVDLWASWCGWCRKETPFVRKAYDRYKDRGLDVISVSVDVKDAAWRKALQEDQPSWTQVVDSRGTKDGLFKWYNLEGIPAIFLIDADGYIVARDLRGDEISKAVGRIIND